MDLASRRFVYVYLRKNTNKMNVDEIFARMDAALELVTRCNLEAEKRLQETVTKPIPATPQTPQKREPELQKPQVTAQFLYESMKTDPSHYNKIIGQLRQEYSQSERGY